MLHNDCHVEVLNEQHLLTIVRALHQCINKAMQSRSDQICLSYISKEDERLFKRENIMLSAHDTSL